MVSGSSNNDFPGSNEQKDHYEETNTDKFSVQRPENVIPTPKPLGVDDQDGENSPISYNTISISRAKLSQNMSGTCPAMSSEELMDISNAQTQKTIPTPQYAQRETLKIYCHNCHQKLDVTFMEPFSTFSCPSCSTSLIAPRWFDNFLLEERIGSGGMSSVYRALDLTLDREVAIKILNEELANNEQSCKLFLDEAKAAARISSHGVVPVFSCGIFEKSAYIVMQYMGGQSLAEVIKQTKGTIALPLVTQWIRDIADGLRTAEQSGLIHHDVKPGNIMLDFEGNAKLCDFGLSQVSSDFVAAASKGWLSPHYVSPERLTDNEETSKGDIYSLGITFFHILTGQTVFRGDDIETIIKARLSYAPPSLKTYRDDVPEKLETLVTAMINFKPEDRPDYDQLISVLDDYLQTTGKKNGKKSFRRKHTFSKTQSGDRADTPLIYRFISSFIKIAMIMFIAVTAYFTYTIFIAQTTPETPLFIKKIQRSISGKVEDCYPEITQLITNGLTVDAQQLLEKVNTEPTTDPDAYNQANLKLAFCLALNNDKDLKNKLKQINNRLIMENVADSTPKLLLNYLTQNQSDLEILAKVIKNNDAKALARSASIIKKCLDRNSKQSILFAIQKYRTAAKLCEEPFWGRAWLNRLEDWEKSILEKDADKKTRVIEPLFAQIKNNLPEN